MNDVSDSSGDQGKPFDAGVYTDFTFKPAKDLDRAMRQTARSRFNAAKRLQARDRKITRLTALSSSYLIALSVMPYFLVLPERVEDHVNLVTVFIAVVILVSSLLQYSRSDVVAAEQHHRSALETNEIVRDAAARAPTAGPDEYLEMCKRYNHVLHKYSVNHEEVDYDTVILDRPQDYPWATPWVRFRMWSRVTTDRIGPDLFLIILSLLLAWMVIAYVLPSQVPASDTSAPSQHVPAST